MVLAKRREVLDAEVKGNWKARYAKTTRRKPVDEGNMAVPKSRRGERDRTGISFGNEVSGIHVVYSDLASQLLINVNGPVASIQFWILAAPSAGTSGAPGGLWDRR